MFDNRNQNNNINLKLSTSIAALTVLIGGVTFSPRPALSQQNQQLLIAQNAAISAESAQQETLYLNNDRTYSYNLIAQSAGEIGGVEIPAGATIVGQQYPALEARGLR